MTLLLKLSENLLLVQLPLSLVLLFFFIMEHHFKRIDWFNSLKKGDKLLVLLLSPNGKLYVEATVIESAKNGYIFIKTSSDTKITLNFRKRLKILY